jgi:hypothetical protein
MSEEQKIARIWYEIKNAPRYDYYRDGIGEQEDGEYLDRGDVIAIIEKYLDKNA